MEELLLCHANLPRSVAPRRRLCVIVVAMRAKPTNLAIPGLPPAPVALAPEPVLPSPHAAADATSGMCPELLSIPAETIAVALRFLTEEAGVPEVDLPRVLRRRSRLLVSPVAARLWPTLYFLRALGVLDLHCRANLLSFSVEDKMLPQIEFLESLGLPSRATRSMACRFRRSSTTGSRGTCGPYLLGTMGRDANERFEFLEYFSYALTMRIVQRHKACTARGVRMPLLAMLHPGEAKFRAMLAGCVESMPLQRWSPLWHATWVDDDDHDDADAVAKEVGPVGV